MDYVFLVLLCYFEIGFKISSLTSLHNQRKLKRGEAWALQIDDIPRTQNYVQR